MPLKHPIVSDVIPQRYFPLPWGLKVWDRDGASDYLQAGPPSSVRDDDVVFTFGMPFLVLHPDSSRVSRFFPFTIGAQDILMDTGSSSPALVLRDELAGVVSGASKLCLSNA